MLARSTSFGFGILRLKCGDRHAQSLHLITHSSLLIAQVALIAVAVIAVNINTT
jgi:hypothetical protein